MWCFYWLINKETGLTYRKAELSQAAKTKLNAGRKKVESVRSHVVPLETDAGTLPSKPKPRGDTQINGDGLI